MADTDAQDTQGQVAQPAQDQASQRPPEVSSGEMPEVTITAPKNQPQPTQADLDYLNANPDSWPKYEQHFGALPHGWSASTPAKPLPTDADIAYLKDNPDTAGKYQQHFGSLPEGFKAGSASWSDVATSASTNIGAGIARIGAAAEEMHGESKFNDARKQYWQAMVLPDAVRYAKANNIALTDDPLVQQAAEHVGIRPDQFARDWPQYVNQSPDELKKVMDQNRDDMAAGAATRASGRAKREQAGQVEKGFTPAGNLSTPQSLALNMAGMAPELLGGTAISMIPGGAFPAAALLAGDMSLRSYSQGRDAGLGDQQAKMYAVLSGAAGSVPEVPVFQALSRAPGANRLIQSAIGKQLAESSLGKVAGTSLNQGLTQTVVTGLQQAIDAGYIDKNMSLPDALRELGAGLVNGSVVGAAMGGLHVGTHRLVNGPKTPADLQDEQAQHEINAQDQQNKLDQAGEPQPIDTALHPNAVALQALQKGDQVDPETMAALQKAGLAAVGKTTGKAMVLPAGRRMLADALKAQDEAKSKAAEGDNGEGFAKAPRTGEAAPEAPSMPGKEVAPTPSMGGEEADTGVKAPRTPGEAEDLAAAETRREQDFPQPADTGADTDRAYAERQQQREGEAQAAREQGFQRAQADTGAETARVAEYAPESTGKAVTSMADAMSMARRAPEDIARQIPRAAGLDANEQGIESNFVQKLSENLPAAIREYNQLPTTLGGKVISTDDARMLSPDFRQKPEVSQAVHEPASWLADIMYKQRLAQPPRPGEENLVTILAGGSGSGKSSTIENAGPLTKHSQIIYDTTFSDPASAADKVQSALNAGKYVSVPFVYSDPIKAFKNSLERSMANGRVVPAHVMQETHAGAPQAVKAMRERFGDDPRVSFIGIDNSLGDGTAEVADVDELMKKRSRIGIGEMRAIAKEYLNDGRITPEIYAQTLGERAPGARAENGKDGNRDEEYAQRQHQEAEGRGSGGVEESAVDQGKLDRIEKRARRRFQEERSRREAMDVGGGQPGPYNRLADHVETALSGLGKRQDVGAHEFLDTLAKAAANKDTDPYLNALVSALRQHAPDAPVRFVDRIISSKTGKEIKNATGLFGADGSVQIKRSANPAMQIKVGLHELVHAATMRELHANPDGELAKRLSSLLQNARDLVAKKYGQVLLDDHLQHFERGGEITTGDYHREFYGLSDVDEMLAEAFTNKKFQDLLNSLGGTPAPERPTGIFAKLVDAVKRFMGVKDEASGLLADIISTGGQVMQAQQKTLPALYERGASQFRDAIHGREAFDREEADKAGGKIAEDLDAGKMSKLVMGAADLGALKIVRGVSRFEDWSQAMIGELGARVKPALDRLYQMAKDRTVDVYSLVYKTRKGGEIVSAPPGTRKDDLAPLRSRLRKLAREGEFGKDWYKESSEAIIDAVNGDRDEAKKFAGLLSIYSQGAAVSANTTMALRAWYQFKAGQKIDAGTSLNNKLAQEWLTQGVEPTGMKRSNFYGNILQTLEGDDQNLFRNGVTVDRWMMRALGYKTGVPGDAQYGFVADQIRRVAKSLKWTPEQAQAAIWIAIKARWESVSDAVNKVALKKGWISPEIERGVRGSARKVLDPERYYGKMLDEALKATLDKDAMVKAGANFRTELLKHRAQVSWEAMPSLESGRLRGVHELPIEAMESFQRDVAAAHVNPETGNDHLMEALGILSLGRVDGNSAWFNDHGQVMRFRHWSIQDGLSHIDPKLQGTGAAASRAERERQVKVTSLYPYELGQGQPEKLVTNQAQHQYVLEVPAAKLYDMSRDPRGYREAAQEPISIDIDGNPTDYAYSHDAFERMVRDAGFSGYYVSDAGDNKLMQGQARMFESWPATKADKYVDTQPSVEKYVKAGGQEILYAPLDKGAAEAKGAPLDPAARTLMESYAAAMGQLNGQNAVGWHRPRWDVPRRDGNGMDMRLPNPDREDFMRAYKAVRDAMKGLGLSDARAAEFAPIQTENGMRFVNWGAADNVKFQDATREALTRAFADRKPEFTHFAADGGLIDNDWNLNRNGEQYAKLIADNGHTQRIGPALAAIRGRLDEVYRAYAKRHGLEDATGASARTTREKDEAAAPVPLDKLVSGTGLYENVVGRFGRFEAGDTLDKLKVYDLKPLVDNPDRAVNMSRDLGFGIEYFSFEADPSKGVEFRIPRLGKNGYEGGKLWIYDPRIGHDSFYDTEYSRAWRITHELGHALTEQFMQSRYGDSRRYGRLGQDLLTTRGVLGKQRQVTERALTLAEAQRAVEWEDTAFRAQRELLKKLGVSISDEDFAREYNTNLSDAMYRVLSGDFGDPGLRGFVPDDKPYALKDALSVLANAEDALARAQERQPTEGIDRDRWHPVSDADIRDVIENTMSGGGKREIKFAARPGETVDYRVVAKDSDGNEIDGPHKDLLFNDKDDARDYSTGAAEMHALDVGGQVDHGEEESTVTRGDRHDRTYGVEPVSRNPYKAQVAKSRGQRGAAGDFVREFENQYPSMSGMGRLINGNVAADIISDVSDPRGMKAYISTLRSFEPGKGAGTKALADIVGLADKHGVTLELNAIPLDAHGIPDEKLVGWYKRLGFETVSDLANLMRREPKEKPEPVKPYATNEGKGISEAEAAQVIEHAKRLFPQAQHHLAQSVEDLPHDVQAVAAVRGLSDRVQAVYVRDYDGTHVYLVQNNARSTEEALRTMIEENVGHDGIAKTFGPAVGKLMDGFIRNGVLGSSIRRVAAREGIDIDAAKTPLERKEALRAAAEEWVAHVAGARLAGQMNFAVPLHSVISEVKVWLASKGVPITLNERDAMTMLTRAHRYVSSAGWMTRISEAREGAEADRFKFAAVPPSGNADLDELLNEKIGAPKVGWRTRLSQAMTDIRSRAVVSGLDRMYRVKQYEADAQVPPAESGYISMRLSTNVAPLLRNLIEFGHLKWTETLGFDPDKSMAPDFKVGKPLNEVLAPLGNDPAMLRRFEGYLVALRSRELMTQGRENLLEQRHIQAGLDLAQQYPHFVQMQRDLAALNKNTLDFAERAGVIDPEARKLWESDYYVPFYRVLDDTGAGPWSAGSLAKVRNPINRLMGGKENLNDITGNVVRNWSSLINASIKAHAVRVAVDNLSQAGVAQRVPGLERGGDVLVSTSEVNKLLAQHGINGALSPSSVGAIQKLMSLSTPQGNDIVQVWRGGKREYWRVDDPMLVTAFAAMKGSALKALSDDPIGKWVVGAARGAKSVFTKLTTENPAFGIRTLWKDNINAWTIGRGMMPVTPVASAVSGLVKSMRADDAFKRMAAAGATFNAGRADPYDTNVTAQRYITAPTLVGRLWDGYRDMMMSGENASRVTIYERTEKETGSHKIGAYEARDLMDYAMRGASPIIQTLVETIPFWGAHVQGLYKTARSLVPENSLSYTQLASQVGKKMAPLLIKGALLSSLAAGLYMVNKDNPAYQELPDIQKELYYNIYFGNYRMKIPKAFESGTVFGTVPEAMMDAAINHDPQTAKEDAEYVMHAFGAGLNLYPRVQALTPLYELQTNRDISTGAPILSEHDIKLMPQQQVGPDTSPLLTAAAQRMPSFMPEALQSPKRLEFLYSGYLGLTGLYGLNAADYMFRKASGGAPAATRNLSQVPIVGSFINRTDQPPGMTRSLNDLSQVMIEANKLQDTVSDLRKQATDESLAQALKLEQDNQALDIAGRAMKPVSDEIRRLQGMKRQVRGAPDMSPDDKQKTINELQGEINDAARGVREYRPGGKLNRELLQNVTSAVAPQEKAKILRKNDMPALASIVLQHARGLPPAVQAAIEELG